jgi:hypothetical protein
MSAEFSFYDIHQLSLAAPGNYFSGAAIKFSKGSEFGNCNPLLLFKTIMKKKSF